MNKPIMMMGFLFLGELNANTGRKEEALENLKKAKKMCKEMEMNVDYYPNKIQEVLDRL
jgi:hypothetical protein